MFSHRGLFLAVTISLASIVIAGVLYQPGHEHQYNCNPRYLQDQSAPQYWTQSPIEQYRAEQSPDQESTRYRPGVQTVYPYEWNQVNARSSEPIDFPAHTILIPAWPVYYFYRLLTEKDKDPKETRRETAEDDEEDDGEKYLRYINGEGYKRRRKHSLQPLMVHNRRKRSDPASTESEVVAHDNDVAAKSLSTDAKHLATIDSLLPEHEPTDTTDKRVENRQIRNDYVTNPRSIGFYTEDTHPEHTYNIPNKWQSMINQYYTNRHSEPPNVAQGEACRDDYNRPLMRFAQSSSSQKSNDNDYSSKYRDNGSDSAADTVKETRLDSLLKEYLYNRPDLIGQTPYAILTSDDPESTFPITTGDKWKTDTVKQTRLESLLNNDKSLVDLIYTPRMPNYDFLTSDDPESTFPITTGDKWKTMTPVDPFYPYFTRWENAHTGMSVKDERFNDYKYTPPYEVLQI